MSLRHGARQAAELPYWAVEQGPLLLTVGEFGCQDLRTDAPLKDVMADPFAWVIDKVGLEK